MSIVDNIHITKNICLHHGEEQTNYNLSFESVENLVLNYIEDATGCTIFNKSNMLLELKTLLDNQPNDLIKELSNIINKNIIPQINFEKLFKSDLEFTFVFNQDEIVILYKNKKVELNSLNDIKKDLLENKSNYLPVITELFIENIGNIIEKLIKKDMSVKYYLINIPIPYWKLFEIKSLHFKEVSCTLFSPKSKCFNLMSKFILSNCWFLVTIIKVVFFDSDCTELAIEL